MNSYAKRYVSEDPTIRSWIGWKRSKDRRLVFASVAFVFIVYNAVYWSEEKEKTRRHKSIEKDIERERWRAQELGLKDPTDDGFAVRYIAEVEAAEKKKWI